MKSMRVVNQHFRKGKRLYDQQPTRDFVGALAEFQAVVRIYPQHYEAWWYIAQCHRNIPPSNLPLAVEAYTNSLQIKPTWDTYLPRGSAYLALGDYPAAITDLTHSIRLHPDRLHPDGRSYYYRSCAYAALGEFQKALADAKESVKRIPTYAPRWLAELEAKAIKINSHFQEGKRFYDQQPTRDFVGALAEFQAVVRIDSQHYESWWYIGICYSNILPANLPLAVEADTNSLQTNPGSLNSFEISVTKSAEKLNSTDKSAYKPVSNLIPQIAGLSYQPVLADGHCLFHAVGLYLGQEQNILRGVVATYLERNPDICRFLQLPEGRSIEAYLQDLRNGIEWASHVEIEVLMRVFNRPIMVVESNGAITNPNDAERFSSEPIFVYYNGHNHYDAYLLTEGANAREIVNHLLTLPTADSAIQSSVTQFNETPQDPLLSKEKEPKSQNNNASPAKVKSHTSKDGLQIGMTLNFSEKTSVSNAVITTQPKTDLKHDQSSIISLSSNLETQSAHQKSDLVKNQISKTKDPMKDDERLSKENFLLPQEGASKNVDNDTIFDYVKAVFSGTYATAMDYVNMLAHPVDECLYPMSVLAYDATIIAAGHEYASFVQVGQPIDVAFTMLQHYVAQNPQLYIDAAARMQAMGNSLKATGEKFVNASGPKKVEMATHAITSVLVPGVIFKAARVAANMYRFRTTFAPPRFKDTYQQAPIVEWNRVQFSTVEQIREMIDYPQSLLWVLTKKNKLLITPKYQNVGDGFQYIAELHHQELGRLQEVLGAGEASFDRFGKLTQINNDAGRYHANGPHLPNLIERAFVQKGFDEAVGKFLNKHMGGHNDVKITHTSMFPSLTVTSFALQVAQRQQITSYASMIHKLMDQPAVNPTTLQEKLTPSLHKTDEQHLNEHAKATSVALAKEQTEIQRVKTERDQKKAAADTEQQQPSIEVKTNFFVQGSYGGNSPRQVGNKMGKDAEDLIKDAEKVVSGAGKTVKKVTKKLKLKW